jgi:hypothetical protein
MRPEGCVAINPVVDPLQTRSQARRYCNFTGNNRLFHMHRQDSHREANRRRCASSDQKAIGQARRMQGISQIEMLRPALSAAGRLIWNQASTATAPGLSAGEIR